MSIGVKKVGGAVTPANVDALVAQLQRHYQATQSFSAKFKETVTRAGGNPVERSGVISYQKPGKLRWDFATPQPETIVSNGKTIFDYDPGLNQVVETPLHQALKSQAAAAFLLGVGNLQRDFKATPVARGAATGLDEVALTPRGGGEQIEVGIDPGTYNIATLVIGDSMGNRTELTFTEIELNKPLQASQFEFTPPGGADIVNSQGGQ
ncbi:MAG TPA: outer membrane lipoprotein chaperone LolA [Candidatus Binataceae bacterium]|nr:outer membrane lipoprotein chaperone LolA [Candidatus Binataceae bacterium]